MAEIKTRTLDGYLRLIEISRDLASTLDLDTLLSDIVHAAADITAAEAASILLSVSYTHLTLPTIYSV